MLNGFFVAHAARSSAADHAEAVSHRAERAAERVRTENQSIEFDIDKLFLITNALWTILKEQHGYTDEELVRRIDELDLMDGKLDGKLGSRSERPDCVECGRKVMSRKNKCIYCGARQPTDPFGA